MEIIKYVAVANIQLEYITLHRGLEFLTEAEVDAFIAEHPTDGYEKIPVSK